MSQLVKRGDAIQSIKGSDKIFTGEVKIVPLSESVPGMPVSEEALQALLMNMQVRHYPKGTYIVQAGVTDRLVYFIEEGVTRSVFHHDGQDTTTWFSQEGDVTFGMDSLYYQQPSVESIETLSDCKIYVIHIDKLNALYETYIDIANWGRILHQNVNKELSHMFVERSNCLPKSGMNNLTAVTPD